MRSCAARARCRAARDPDSAATPPAGSPPRHPPAGTRPARGPACAGRSRRASAGRYPRSPGWRRSVPPAGPTHARSLAPPAASLVPPRIRVRRQAATPLAAASGFLPPIPRARGGEFACRRPGKESSRAEKRGRRWRHAGRLQRCRRRRRRSSGSQKAAAASTACEPKPNGVTWNALRERQDEE